MKNKSFKKDVKLLIYINIAVTILLFSIFNLWSYTKSAVKVLGVKTDKTFWEELVAKHPTYIDGWIELGRMDVVKQIDPNYPQ